MFVIWGWRAFSAVIGTGVFLCPQCRTDRGYRHVHPRRWFTIFFIPFIPLNKLPPHVECETCKGAFIEDVLAAPTAAQLEYAIGLASRAAVGHLVSITGVTSVAVTEAAALLAQSPGVAQPYDDRRLHTDAAVFADPATALGYVAPLAGLMPADGREDFIRRLVLFAERVDPVATEAAVSGLATAVELSAAHLAGIRAQGAGGPA